MKTGACYWRFKGEKPWRYGWVTRVYGSLFRMGYHNGDTTHGPVVDPKDVEARYES